MNHDENDTVDLVSKYTLRTSSTDSDDYAFLDNSLSVNYEQSKCNYIYNRVIYGFTDKVRLALKPISFEVDGTYDGSNLIRGLKTFTSKIKCPSLAEVGWYDGSFSLYGCNMNCPQWGTIYPVFGSPASSNTAANTLTIVNDPTTNKASIYTTRSLGGSTSTNYTVTWQTYLVNSGGYIMKDQFSSNMNSYNRYAIGIIRFSTSKDYNALCSEMDPAEYLSSGKVTKDDIGKTVHLTNDVVPENEWLIADVNHDGNANTIDLISKYVFTVDSSKVDKSSLYENSAIRTYLNGEFYNKFYQSIKNIMVPITVPRIDGSISDKVMIPTLKELGVGYYKNADYRKNTVLNDGTTYPIFKDYSNSDDDGPLLIDVSGGFYRNADSGIIRVTYNSQNTRTVYKYGDNDFGHIRLHTSDTGIASIWIDSYYNATMIYRPIIRIKTK